MPNPYYDDEEEEDPQLSGPIPPTYDADNLSASPILDMSQIQSPPPPLVVPPSAATGPMSNDDKLRNYLEEKYAGDIKDARAQRRNSNLLASIGRGLNTISNSVGAKTNNEGYDAMDKQGEQGVSDVQSDYKLGSDKQKMVRDYLMKKDLMGMKGKSYDLQAKMLDDKLRHEKIMEGMTQQQINMKKNLMQTHGEAAVDSDIAKKYAEYVGANGRSKGIAALDKLKSVRDELVKDPSLTGGYVNYLPENMRAKLGEKGLGMEQEVQSAILGNLKQIFGGGHTTEEQMKIFLKKSYDPRLSGEENAKKLTLSINQAESELAQTDKTMKYFEQNHGKMAGFRGDAINAQPASPAANQSEQFNEKQESGIQRVMEHNGVTREEAVKALRDAGKL